jgi:methyl-accepting chemotaxis protein
MFVRSDKNPLPTIQLFAASSAVLISLVGFVVLAARQFDAAILKTLLPGILAMKATTAGAFLLAGLALILLQQPVSIAKVLVLFCAALIAPVGLLTICEYLFGWNPGIDQMLFREPGVLIATSSPGQMAPNIALNFAMTSGRAGGK